MALEPGNPSATEHFNISEARAHLSELVERAASGEEIVISKAGVPQAKLVPVEPLKKRPAGLLAHLFTEEEIAETIRALEEPFDEADWPEFYADITLDSAT